MDSQDQVPQEQSTGEQPNDTTPTIPATVEIDGEEVSIEELKK